MYLTLFIFLVTGFTYSYAGEITLTGYFNGTNIYVQNPVTPQGYCINEIIVNGKKLSKIPQATAFDIPLSIMVKMGEAVEVKIIHSEGCVPKVLNPNAIRTSVQFQFLSVDVTPNGVDFVTKGEKNSSKIVLERFEQSAWVQLVTSPVKGNVDVNNYSIPCQHNSGINKYRIRYVESTGKEILSQEVEYNSNLEPVKFYPLRVDKDLNFTREVSYEILDMYGALIKKGKGIKVDCRDLKMGAYYVVYDNRTEKFFKK
ncbi:MAG: hypothetical protein NZM38_08040 [Cytophagales bacterium]|nr:hypothetical protein [Cytophagales bacterium]MDW8384708.1 hypothetical protein [Flammeovirgaceae bacterium]